MKFGTIKIADPTVCAYPTCSERASVTWKGMPVCSVHYHLARFIDAVVSGEHNEFM
jgi:hypothetical protein